MKTRIDAGAAGVSENRDSPMVPEGGSFQQAETALPEPPSLQIVAKAKTRRREAAKPSKGQPKLTRVAFRVSRLMEFYTRRELQNQTGHAVQDWPLVVLKELVDNALDACEEAEIAPVISIAVKPRAIVVQDNGSGIDAGTIKAILDYTIRVSSREAYVSPTRGAQGNALKTILPMGYVLDRERQDGLNAQAVGETVIETRGLKHRIQFRVDHVNNEPRITHTIAASPLTTGTRITVKWPVTPIYGSVTYLENARDRFLEIAEGYVWFNPHLSLRVRWHGKDVVNASASNPGWQKWRPRDPTSAHWYDETRLQRYLAAHVARDRDFRRDRPVRQFIAEFRGLSGTGKQRQVLAEVGCSHVSLRKFFGVDRVNRAGIVKLLASMKKHSKPVAAKHLGVIGEEHLKKCFELAGGDLKTFRYDRRFGLSDEGIPYVLEAAFGLPIVRASTQEPQFGASSSPESTGASGSTTRSGRSAAPAKALRAPCNGSGPTLSSR